jgi:hypothetical protein
MKCPKVDTCAISEFAMYEKKESHQGHEPRSVCRSDTYETN